MKRTNLLILLLVLVLGSPALAVNHYTCDFESDSARNRWVLNPTANDGILRQLKNRFYIGKPGHNGKTGANGLFISDDGGQTAHYSNTSNFVIAYDTLTLDQLMSAGDYLLSFDYMAMGNMASNTDGLYVLWIPKEKLPNGPMSFANADVPAVYDNYIIQLQELLGIDFINGAATWKQLAVHIPGTMCDGTTHYLVFAWRNGASMAQQPGACIDNIEIVDDRGCEQPDSLKVTISGTNAVLSWAGDAPEYEVSAYSYSDDRWFGPVVTQAHAYSFAGMKAGEADFIVRSKCAEDLYSLKTIKNQLVYYPDQMCVDYLNLDNATCYVNGSAPSSTWTFSDFRKVRPVDMGPSQMGSRHTIHFDHGEVEPRSGGLLKTIPAGELASVRLGNWDHNNEAERIEFSFEVDTLEYSVLLLKYATLLEAPGHLDEENPRFKLDILINGKTIGQCGQADFNCNDVFSGGALLPGAKEQGWHLTPKDVAQTSADIVWKDWTTVGVNLRNSAYQGKKLTVRLTTHDCTFSAHCGYAYFTLGCSDGKLEDMACGQVNPNFKAPEGFAYRWMLASDEAAYHTTFNESLIKGRAQVYEAGYHDDKLYAVDCMFVQDTTCYFTLYASSLATNPIPVVKTPNVIKNCRNGKYIVELDASDSYVQEIDHLTNDTSVSKIYKLELFEWNGGEGRLAYGPQAKLEFPTTGGDYDITFYTSYGSCDTLIHIPLHLDPLGPTADTTTVYFCDDMRKAGYRWSEKPDTVYYDYGWDSVAFVSKATSCDSIIYLHLAEPKRIVTNLMIFNTDLPFTFHGRTYNSEVVDTIPNANCDTTWILNLQLYAPVIGSLKDTVITICGDVNKATLEYTIANGRSIGYTYRFTEAEDVLPMKHVDTVQWKGSTVYTIDIPIPDKIRPNNYIGTLQLFDSLPDWQMILPFRLEVLYPVSVVAQRWNDVLAVRNADFNGGYEFTSYQWYKNGQKIEGQVGSYLYQEKQNLDFGAQYQVELTRKDDGVKMMTCPFLPSQVATSDDLPTLVPVSSMLAIPGRGQAQWVNTLGNNVSHQDYDNSAIMTPATKGVYLLILNGENGRRVLRMVVR